MMRFHKQCGKRITLTNNYTTAMRNVSEFNHGIIFSSAPLSNDVKFEIKIDEMVTNQLIISWIVLMKFIDFRSMPGAVALKLV